MSKTSYKKMMKQQSERLEKHYVRNTSSYTFTPSKDNPVEFTTATFGSPRKVEVVTRRKRHG